MSNEIKMNYAVMEDLLYAIGDAIDSLEITQSEVLKAADMLQEGALISRGGATLEHACRTTLNNKVQNLIDTYVELCQDVSGAMEDMIGADMGN